MSCKMLMHAFPHLYPIAWPSILFSFALIILEHFIIRASWQTTHVWNLEDFHSQLKRREPSCPISVFQPLSTGFGIFRDQIVMAHRKIRFGWFAPWNRNNTRLSLHEFDEIFVLFLENKARMTLQSLFSCTQTSADLLKFTIWGLQHGGHGHVCTI